MQPAAKPRPRREVVMLVIQPLANRVVAALARTRVEPWHVVAAHTLLGFAAAALIAGSGHAAWLAAAVLLQVKTLLDNSDGGLARATGRVTEFGRYFDTVCDLVVNVALFAALSRHGPPAGAWLALLALTAVLSADFNAERLYREARGANGGGGAPDGAPRWAVELVRGLYRLVLAPQDRFFAWLDARLFLAAARKPFAAAGQRERERWADGFSTGALVNLGLSTQYLALGVAMALGMPYAYVVFCLAQLPYLALIAWLRARRYRAAAAPT